MRAGKARASKSRGDSEFDSTGPARNYVLSDGSGTIVARVYETNLPMLADGTR